MKGLDICVETFYRRNGRRRKVLLPDFRPRPLFLLRQDLDTKVGDYMSRKPLKSKRIKTFFPHRGTSNLCIISSESWLAFHSVYKRSPGCMKRCLEMRYIFIDNNRYIQMYLTIFCLEFFIQLSVTLSAKTWFLEAEVLAQNIETWRLSFPCISKTFLRGWQTFRNVFLAGLKCYWNEACNYHLRPPW